MKGKLIKDHEGWWVQHHVEGLDGIDYTGETELHPDDVKQIEEDAKVFDNIEARIAAYPVVEFEVVRYCKKHNSDPSKNSVCTLDCAYEEASYAKLIPFKEQQKQLITEIMNEDAKDGLYDTENELDKLAYQYNPVMKLDCEFIRAGFKAGYKKAKENTYTEEQVREAIDMARKDDNPLFLWEYTPDEIVQSLKQSKQ